MFEFARSRSSSAKPRHRADADASSESEQLSQAVPDARRRLLTLMAAAERERAERDDPGPEAEQTAEQAHPMLAAGGGAVRRFARRWLPESWRESRVDPARAGFLGVLLAGVVVAAVATVTAVTSSPSAEPVPRLPEVTRMAATSSTSTPPDELVVSIVGRVHDPGLVTVDPGARVADALRKVGGPLPGTDVMALNLARELADGEQLYVGVPVPADARDATAPKSNSGDSTGADGKVNLNTAGTEELEELPGVGPVTAKRIVRWRTENDGFDSVEQLMAVSGIGDATLSRLRDLVRV